MRLFQNFSFGTATLQSKDTELVRIVPKSQSSYHPNHQGAFFPSLRAEKIGLSGAEELPFRGNSFWSFAYANSRSKSTMRFCDPPNALRGQHLYGVSVFIMSTDYTDALNVMSANQRTIVQR
jgi:hypothetical protein